MEKRNGKQSDFALKRTDGTQIIIGYNLKKIEGADWLVKEKAGRI